MKSTYDAFAKALVSLVVKHGKPVKIERRTWGKVVEPHPQKSGIIQLTGSNTVIEVGRLGGVYGYLRITAGSCRVEGVLLYGQTFITFKPSTVLGCDGIEEVSAPGLEVVS
jgi:hypothetical protein